MMVWIFVGVVVATTMFLLVMVYNRPETGTATVTTPEMETATGKLTYRHNQEELRSQFLSVNALNNEDLPLKPKVIDTQDNLDEKLWNLAQQLREKEKMMQSAVSKINDAESKLIMESPMNEALERQNRKLIEELKLELQLTELECKNLQDQIRVISARREQLAKEVTKQQHIFNTTMNTLVTDLHFMNDGSSDAGKAMGSENEASANGNEHKSNGMVFGNDAKLLPFTD